MGMEYIYAALLLNAEGKEVTEDSLNNTIKGSGGSPDAAKAKMVVASLQGVNIADVLKSAAAMPVMAAAPAAGGHAHAEGKKAEPKEEKKSEEEAAAGLGSLFG